jgi:hypothetical protein
LRRGGGRPKGSRNRATANAREAIARFVDSNAERVQGWLDAIEKKEGPRAALQCYIDFIEYHVPKLARHEVTGKDGGPVAYTPANIYGSLEPPPPKT